MWDSLNLNVCTSFLYRKYFPLTNYSNIPFGNRWKWLLSWYQLPLKVWRNMKQFNLMCLLLALLVSSIYAADEIDVAAPAGNETITTGATTEAPLLLNPPQCVYDFEGHRLNKGCRVEAPPTCLKGPMVSTMKGDIYELCCCDFSNYVKYEGESE